MLFVALNTETVATVTFNIFSALFNTLYDSQ